jgi:Family of unknown function (DUF6349)
MATVALAEGQLDLFADLDAAAAAAAAAEAQRSFDEAPSMFRSSVRGFFARIAAAEVWSDEHGHFDCLRRSHAWRAEIGGGRSDQPTGVCRPITLTADLRCDHYRDECSCIGDLVYRGACLHCDWEGPVRDDHNGAVEDAHDHAWPSWRDLPCVPRRPELGTSAKQKTAMTRWAETINDVYPDGWLESGGLIRTVRGRYGTRHVPDHTGFGGYDQCGLIEPEPVR